MRVAKGIYENGMVSLPDAPVLPGRREVAVLIPEEGETAALEALRYAGMLGDLTPEEEAAFDDALRRSVRIEDSGER